MDPPPRLIDNPSFWNPQGENLNHPVRNGLADPSNFKVEGPTLVGMAGIHAILCGLIDGVADLSGGSTLKASWYLQRLVSHKYPAECNLLRAYLAEVILEDRARVLMHILCPVSICFLT